MATRVRHCRRNTRLQRDFWVPGYLLVLPAGWPKTPLFSERSNIVRKPSIQGMAPLPAAVDPVQGLLAVLGRGAHHDQHPLLIPFVQKVR